MTLATLEELAPFSLKHEERTCVYCQKPYIARIKSDRNKPKQPTCSRKHREAAMIEGIIRPRYDTGYGTDDILRRRKYYKYLQYDRKFGYSSLTMSVREFCKVLATAKCYYCNSTEDVGLDRIDNKQGHSENNTVWACSLCNMTRGNRFTVDQMIEIGKVIRSFR